MQNNSGHSRKGGEIMSLKMYDAVIAVEESGELIYGRFTGYHEKEIGIYEVWEVVTGVVKNCTDVKKIKEKYLLEWARIIQEANHDR